MQKRILKVSEFQKHLDEFHSANPKRSIHVVDGKKEEHINVEKTFKDMFGYNIVFSATSPWGVMPDDTVDLIKG